MAESLMNFPGILLTEQKDLRTYSPLTLAYLGDAVFELVIRTVLLERENGKNGVIIVLLMRQDNILYFQLFNCRINNKERH